MNKFNLVSFICQTRPGFAYLTVCVKQTTWAGSLWVEKCGICWISALELIWFNQCREKNIKIIKSQPYFNMGINKATDPVLFTACSTLTSTSATFTISPHNCYCFVKPWLAQNVAPANPSLYQKVAGVCIHLLVWDTPHKPGRQRSPTLAAC